MAAVEAESVETAAEHERILREIESTDTACIGPTLRSVYDGAEHQRFLEKLEARIKSHDREIEKMCNFHYQGFVDSITELLKVRSEAGKVKCQVVATNKQLQETGKELVTEMEELTRCRVQQRNIATTVDKLNLCLPVLEMYSKLKEQMKAKRYYPALKMLDVLEQEYLPLVSQYRFSRLMLDTLPRLRQEIRDVSMSDLNDFLESIRKHSDKIGQMAMKQAQSQRSLDSAVHQRQKSAEAQRGRGREAAGPGSDAEPAGNSPASEQDSGILDEDEEEEEEELEEEVLNAQDLVDFSPVYRCLHIYTVLGARDTFENYYRNQRRQQARLVLQAQSNMHETLEGYKKYFNQIVGFFVVEDHILHTTQGLVNRAYMDELWDMALSRIIAVLRTHSSYCTNPNLVLDLKHLIVLFADTVQGYGFSMNQLFDLLLEIRDQYCEILLKKWAAEFRAIFERDNFSPIPVNNDEEYRKIVSQFPLMDAELEKQTFPKKIPFSQFVPSIYTQVKEFIYACLKFSEDLHLSSTEIDDMIRKSANLLLSRVLSSSLQNLIRKPNIGLTELVQIIINTTHLEQSCKYLEDFITNITNVSPETVHTTKLYGTSTFKDARHTAEEEIYTKLHQKIDEFLQLADYDWMLPEPNGHASDYLMDLINFLRSTFAVFTHLPGKVAQTACMSASKHLASRLLQQILDVEVKQVTMGAIQQFNLDLVQCELFASSEPVPGLQGDTLQLAFIDLRQLLDLFMVWDWSTYLADYGHPNNKYLRVNPNTALILLEKMKDHTRKSNIFAQFRKNERDKQKLIETVAKQLRSLANGTAHHS
ncbi:LOW QUALITY PROTEIN: exocyst complex component 6B-like [Lethenteron reissneri]|uniref:LOW QUALITY PROTEIN: exocyst complex component 6B-like n=1 Tax=Lethenteron reissneri TaxID=7753 RepID=UPI002AB7DBC1|nr:LOW QUALITY PROTEIN: exocyst complex component 6B-like [Lethenteron reissneri]